ncbi:hypothetical protein Tco_0661337 [Tanacetum coccineum]
MKRGRHSTSSSSAFDQPSSSHLNDDDDGNDKGTSHAITPSLTRFVNSLTNEVPRVFENPSNVDPDMEQFYTCQTKILNRQVKLRDEHRGGLRSIGKGFKNLWRNMKKKHEYAVSSLMDTAYWLSEHTMDDSNSEELENIFVEDNGKPMDGLVDDLQKKVEAPPKKNPRKTGTWSGRKTDSPKRNVAFSPEMKVHYFDKDDIKEVEHDNAYSKKAPAKERSLMDLWNLDLLHSLAPD